MNPTLLLAAFAVGTVAGSFLATAVLRAEEASWSWLGGRSRCPRCAARLGPRDLVPLLSFFLLRGRCRHCGVRIGWWYPAIEATAGVLAAISFVLQPPPRAALLALLAWILLALALFDARSLRLPDPVTLPLVVTGLAVNTFGARLLPELAFATPRSALLGAGGAFMFLFALGALYLRLRGQAGLGLGDAKLAAAAGAWLGASQLPLYFLIAGLLGLAQAVALGALRRPGLRVPFGPALAASLWLLLVTD